MKTTSLTMLQKELKKWNEQLTEAHIVKSDAENQIRRCKTKINQIQNKINNKNKTQVTDHAIVRYMERVMGVDIKEFEKKILESKECKLIKKNGIVITVK